ncbi:flagellar filament capping protein FliD [Ralstonia soli]|uniref:Flagellar hook-associated protein 2 n=1 Tax=Ralstonia soli TaxID=2953896 RepID=A0ABT1APF6_9RALS|nr:flagellar filament capping protein FliD [Ralstonia soli]MCO5400275.1 flagellar filament capping protein FliD [Ralstonia soli]
MTTTSATSSNAASSAASSIAQVLANPGAGTSLNLSSLVSGLMQVAAIPLNNLQAQQTSYQTQLSAVGSLQSALYTFQSAMAGLSFTSGYSAMQASSSNTSVVGASVTGGPSAGTYAVNVSQLAQSQTLVAQGQTSTSTAIGSGAATTISFSFGSVSGGTFSGGAYSGATFTPNANLPTGTVTINASNNTLQGIASAINAAHVGVQASIVNDGSGTPYRLTLTSTAGGSNSEMKISVSGDAALQSLLGQDPAGTQNMSEVTTGQNAVATINGLQVQSPTNTLSGTIPGMSLALTGTGSSTVSVANNPSAAVNAVNNFVSAYNALKSTLNAATKVDTSNSANNGPLAFDASTRLLVEQVNGVLNQAIGSGSYSSLGSVGITLAQDGTMQVNSAALQTAVTTAPTAVARLFAQSGTATDSLVGVNAYAKTTQAGTYAINVTQLATQGALTGSAAAGTTITQGVNDTLNVTISNTPVTLTIPPGTYSASGLATQLQSLINGSAALQAHKLTANVSADANGVLTIGNNQYGSTSNVAVSGNAASSLFGGSPTSTTGVDVQGTINGVAATSSGQQLFGATGSAVAGLTLQVNGGALGSRGTVTVQRGYASQFFTTATTLLASNGMVQNEQHSLNSTLTSLANRISTMQNQLNQQQALYLKQFNSLSSLVASMSQTQSYLTQQLAALAAQTNGTSPSSK